MSPVDCDLSDTFSRLLWVATTCVSLFTLVLSLFFIALLFLDRDRYAKQIEKNILFYTAAFAGSILIFALSVAKVSGDQDRRLQYLIGEDVFATLFYALGTTVWWFTVFLLLQRLSKFYASVFTLLTGLPMPNLIPYPFVTLTSLVMIFSFLPFVCLAVPESSPIVAVIHHLGLALTISAFVFYFGPKYLDNVVLTFEGGLENIKKMENKELAIKDTSSQVNSLLAMIWKLKKLKSQIVVEGVIMVMLFVIFGIFPFLTRKSQYLLAVNLSCLGIVVSASIIVVANEIWKYSLLKTILQSSKKRNSSQGLLSSSENLFSGTAAEQNSLTRKVSASVLGASATDLLGRFSYKRSISSAHEWESKESRQQWLQQTLKEDGFKSVRESQQDISIGDEVAAEEIFEKELSVITENDNLDGESELVPPISTVSAPKPQNFDDLLL